MTEFGTNLEIRRRRAAACAAILAQAGIDTGEDCGEFRAMSLGAIAEEFALASGADVVGLPRSEAIGRAFASGTSDFPNLVLSTMNKAALRGYDAAGESYPRWCSVGSLPDFRSVTRASAGLFPDLLTVPENAQFTEARLEENAATLRLATYGRVWNCSRQAVINDDSRELVGVPLRAGRAAARLVGSLAAGVLSGNPTMADGNALFSAAHGNDAAVGAAPSSASISATAALIAAQKSANNTLIGAAPRFLICPPGLEGTARAVVSSQYFSGPQGFEQRPNSAPQLEVIADPRLTGTAWYLVCDPAQFDGIEVSFLGGATKPVVEPRKRFERDGAIVKIRLDTAAAPLDWRALARNAGA